MEAPERPIRATAPFLVAACSLAVALMGSCGPLFGAPGPVDQPIAFNHKVHVEQDLACTDCHKDAERGLHATIPGIRTCLLCHEEAQGNHPDEARIREYAAAGGQIPWIQVNRLPGHVHFSHVAHVKYAQMSCQTCHGPMEEQTEPVTIPQIGHLDMNHCVACHEERQASTDCLRCHK